jgi:hypothetical protein
LTPRLSDGLAALAAGALVAGVTVVGYRAALPKLPPGPPVGDRVAAAVAAFRSGDHVFVTADGRRFLSRADEARLEKKAAASRPAVYVAVWDGEGEAGYYTDFDAVQQIEDAVGRDGAYLLWEGTGDGLLDTRGGLLEPSVEEDFHGEAALRLPEMVAAVDHAELSENPQDFSSTLPGEVLLGLLLAALALPVVLLVLGLLRVVFGLRFRLGGSWR